MSGSESSFVSFFNKLSGYVSSSEAPYADPADDTELDEPDLYDNLDASIDLGPDSDLSDEGEAGNKTNSFAFSANCLFWGLNPFAKDNTKEKPVDTGGDSLSQAYGYLVRAMHAAGGGIFSKDTAKKHSYPQMDCEGEEEMVFVCPSVNYHEK
ncbi:MAG: hypothetical protein HON78_00800 [Legionellales bacterium]|jgi:hypothetical protein|nr:hypothetical protein [Legionellales bacterium]